MCDIAHCGPVVDWRRGKLPGEWRLACLVGWCYSCVCWIAACCLLRPMYTCSCLLICNCMIFAHDMMLLMCMILYMYMQMLMNMYMLLYVYMLMYVLALLLIRHMMKFGNWWQHISCQLDGRSNVCVCVYVNNVLQIWFSFSDFIFWFGNSISIFWFGFSIFIF